MSSPSEKSIVASARRLVIKVGSSLVTNDGRGIDHAAVGIVARAMRSMALRGFVEHDRATGAYSLSDSGRATLAMILDHAGIKVPPK